MYTCLNAVARKAMDLGKKSNVAGGLGTFSTRGAREPGRSSARLGQRQRSTLGDAQRKGVIMAPRLPNYQHWRPVIARNERFCWVHVGSSGPSPIFEPRSETGIWD